jgi:hypothetical protein
MVAPPKCGCIAPVYAWLVIIGIPPSNLRVFSMFYAQPSNKQWCPARCAYAADVLGKDLDIFALGPVTLYNISARNC